MPTDIIYWKYDRISALSGCPIVNAANIIYRNSFLPDSPADSEIGECYDADSGYGHDIVELEVPEKKKILKVREKQCTTDADAMASTWKLQPYIAHDSL